MVPGLPVQVVKLHPDGHEVTRYDAVVADEGCSGDWFAVQATWVNRLVSLHGLDFETGDTLVEFFCVTEWFNVFRVQSPQGHVRGWYANVTYPVRVEQVGSETTVTWHDLFLDIIRLPDGSVVLCDEDELADSGLAARDPGLHARIVETARQMVTLAEAGDFPFHERHL